MTITYHGRPYSFETETELQTWLIRRSVQERDAMSDHPAGIEALQDRSLALIAYLAIGLILAIFALGFYLAN